MREIQIDPSVAAAVSVAYIPLLLAESQVFNVLEAASNEICLTLVHLVNQHLENFLADHIVFAAGFAQEKEILGLSKCLCLCQRHFTSWDLARVLSLCGCIHFYKDYLILLTLVQKTVLHPIVCALVKLLVCIVDLTCTGDSSTSFLSIDA